MSAQILEFPTPIRLEQFFAEAALCEQVRMCLSAACGVYTRPPTDADRIFALAKIEEAIILIQSERALSR